MQWSKIFRYRFHSREGFVGKAKPTAEGGGGAIASMDPELSQTTRHNPIKLTILKLCRKKEEEKPVKRGGVLMPPEATHFP